MVCLTTLIQLHRLSDDIVTGYKLEDQSSSPEKNNNYSCNQNIVVSFGSHSDTYQMGTGGYFPIIKVNVIIRPNLMFIYNGS